MKTYKATIYGDDEEGKSSVKTEEKIVSKSDLIPINLDTAGGCVIVIEPILQTKK